jgi:hypothetical protein
MNVKQLLSLSDEQIIRLAQFSITDPVIRAEVDKIRVTKSVKKRYRKIWQRVGTDTAFTAWFQSISKNSIAHGWILMNGGIRK